MDHRVTICADDSQISRRCAPRLSLRQRLSMMNVSKATSYFAIDSEKIEAAARNFTNKMTIILAQGRANLRIPQHPASNRLSGETLVDRSFQRIDSRGRICQSVAARQIVNVFAKKKTQFR